MKAEEEVTINVSEILKYIKIVKNKSLNNKASSIILHS